MTAKYAELTEESNTLDYLEKAIGFVKSAANNPPSKINECNRLVTTFEIVRVFSVLRLSCAIVNNHA